MQSPNDWKNVEMTGYFKVNSFTKANQNGPPHIELVARGVRNTNDIGTIDGLSRQCEATTYHSNTYLDGSTCQKFHIQVSLAVHTSFLHRFCKNLME